MGSTSKFVQFYVSPGRFYEREEYHPPILTVMLAIHRVDI